MLRIILYFSSFLSLIFLGMIFYSIILYLKSDNPARNELLVIGAYGILWLIITIFINLGIRYLSKINLSKFENYLVWMPVFSFILGNGIHYMLV